MSAETSPRPHWGNLQCSPDPLAGFKRAASQEEGNGGEGRGGLGERKRESEGKGGNGEGGQRGK